MFVENFFKKRGFHVSPVFELGSYDLVLEFTKINLGISCVIKEFSMDYLRRGDVYEVCIRRENSKEEYWHMLFKKCSLITCCPEVC